MHALLIKDELEKWCWKPYEGVMEIAIDCDFDDDGLRAAFDAFGLDSHPAFDDESNPLPGANICHSATHLAEGYYDEDPLEEQIYEVDGVRYMLDTAFRGIATGAYYQFAINTGGAIIGINFMSPRMAAALPYAWGRTPLPQELPKLQFASDVMWGYWVQGNPHFAHDIRSLRLYVGHEVINPETVALVWRALEIAGRTELEEWPGVSFFLGTAEYKALIGSPIGATAAHMLIGHKAELGLKWITKVTVIKNWVPPGGALTGKLHLFFHIEDVPEGPLPHDLIFFPEPAAMGGNKRQAEKTGNEDSHATRVHKIMA
ncbi:WD domain-containing [Pyrenophora seminiperda CCB06]|uniref:WD domain-containing n=1 Tax=Pyrenophora seminiperda CCB06 TaxID=1302712 RepID=A0A3M7M428_9PLEO|nr:WD domain-containing [Pyrenophora seminiperda CCB06]